MGTAQQTGFPEIPDSSMQGTPPLASHQLAWTAVIHAAGCDFANNSYCSCGSG